MSYYEIEICIPANNLSGEDFVRAFSAIVAGTKAQFRTAVQFGLDPRYVRGLCAAADKLDGAVRSAFISGWFAVFDDYAYFHIPKETLPIEDMKRIAEDLQPFPGSRVGFVGVSPSPYVKT